MGFRSPNRSWRTDVDFSQIQIFGLTLDYEFGVSILCKLVGSPNSGILRSNCSAKANLGLVVQGVTDIQRKLL